MIEISFIDDELTGCTLLFLRDDTPIAEIRPHFLHRLLMSQPPPFDLPGFVWDPVYVDVANKEEAALFQAAKCTPPTRRGFHLPHPRHALRRQDARRWDM